MLSRFSIRILVPLLLLVWVLPATSIAQSMLRPIAPQAQPNAQPHAQSNLQPILESTPEPEYQDHFVIAPSIQFSSRSNDFTVNALNEKGQQVEHGFEYDSQNNPHFLTPSELLSFNKIADL